MNCTQSISPTGTALSLVGPVLSSHHVCAVYIASFSSSLNIVPCFRSLQWGCIIYCQLPTYLTQLCSRLDDHLFQFFFYKMFPADKVSHHFNSITSSFSKSSSASSSCRWKLSYWTRWFCDYCQVVADYTVDLDSSCLWNNFCFSTVNTTNP